MGQDPEAIRADIEHTRAEMGDTVEAIGYKADVKSRTKDRMTNAKEKITGKVSGATPDSGQVKDQARRTAGVAQENPLGLAVGSIAVGFLAGMLIPTSRMEDEKIGPMAEQVREQVKETGQEAFEHGKEVAAEAAASAKQTAEETGRQHAEDLRSSTQERVSSNA